LSFEIYHPKNNVHNQDGNHDDNKVDRITIFFFELTDNDGQNSLAGIENFFFFLNDNLLPEIKVSILNRVGSILVPRGVFQLIIGCTFIVKIGTICV
jgi:hypothetical protein